MRIANLKCDDIINTNQNIIVFPTGLYNIPQNSELNKIVKIFPRSVAHLKQYVKQRIVDVGGCSILYLINNIYIAFLITCFSIDENQKKNIDYEMLYSSLLELSTDALNKNIKKIGFCIDDLLNIGCDIDIFKSMVKSIFNNYNIKITFIHGK